MIYWEYWSCCTIHYCTDMVCHCAVKMLVALVSRIFPEFQFGWLAEETRKNLPLELDFVHEARNCEKVAKNFAHLHFLKACASYYINSFFFCFQEMPVQLLWLSFHEWIFSFACLLIFFQHVHHVIWCTIFTSGQMVNSNQLSLSHETKKKQKE